MTFVPLLFAIYAPEEDHNLAKRLQQREPSASPSYMTAMAGWRIR